MNDVAEGVRGVLASEPAVMSAYLFGSAAAGRQQAWSDVDVAVLLDEGRTDRAGFALELALGGALEQALRSPVDLVNLRRAPPFLQFQVLKDGILVLDRDTDARSLFVMAALNTYYDMQRYFDYQNACVLERFQQRGLSGRQEGPRHPAEETTELRRELAGAAAG